MLPTWRLRLARRGALGLGLGPHMAAARLPDGRSTGPGTERAGTPPSSRAPGGRPGLRLTHRAEGRPFGPTLPRQGLSRWAPHAGGDPVLPLPWEGGWRGSSFFPLGKTQWPAGVAKGWGSQAGQSSF